MERDAVSAGVNPVGGLFSTAEVRILICYILTALDEAVPGQLLAETLHYEGIANCFEVNDSIAHLVKSGQLLPVDEKEDTYIITKSGKYVAETLKTTLSMTVKQRAYDAAYKMLSRFKNAKETDIKISREGDRTFITCSVKDGDETFMSVKLLVCDEDHALHIKEKFLLNPTEIFTELVEKLSN